MPCGMTRGGGISSRGGRPLKTGCPREVEIAGAQRRKEQVALLATEANTWKREGCGPDQKGNKELAPWHPEKNVRMVYGTFDTVERGKKKMVGAVAEGTKMYRARIHISAAIPALHPRSLSLSSCAGVIWEAPLFESKRKRTDVREKN